ncbi:response regulator transcription factor [Emticicia sp.]|uniref:response regulator transcription factor n=1 Tax=Emticicia sp. TaxID=1930953 RepID=UPI0037506B62
MSLAHRVLVVDDEADIVELLSYNLEKEGYKVASAPDGKKAIEIAKEFLPDLVILDIMMPHLDGIEVGRMIRAMPELKSTYILYLTARSEEYSEIAAFEVGADDYLNKPIKPRALMSRINAFFRREAQKTDPTETLEVAGLNINRLNYTVTKPDGSLVVLPKKEFELLFFLAQYPNKVFSRDEILQKIWGIDVYVVERTIDVHIRKVREKVGETFIKTLKGVGYMFTDEV